MRHVIAGNWKMYKDSEQARKYFQELGSRAAPDASRVEVLMFPGFVALGSLACQGVVPSWVSVGAQDVSSEPEGAFTGEVSPSMIRAAGGTFVLLGHSERRHVVGESDALVRAKLLNAVQGGLSPVLCIGESLKEREEGRVREVLFRQLDSALAGACITQAMRLMIAYEPVWAIGTGVNADRRGSRPRARKDHRAFGTGHCPGRSDSVRWQYQARQFRRNHCTEVGGRRTCRGSQPEPSDVYGVGYDGGRLSHPGTTVLK
jgi:triosephosphate isomerase